MLSTEILSGLRVLEWSEGVAGPYCTKLLADLGAEVIKIESPQGGDPARERGTFSNETDHPDEGGLFLLMNTNKKGITLDPSNPVDRDLFFGLIKKMDCLIEDRPPGEMQKMGLGPSELLKLQPGLVVTSITPFGQTGPYAHYKAYPLNTFHGGGSGYLLPLEDEHPKRTPIRLWRHCGETESGVTASLATLAAVLHAKVTGEGQHIDISKIEALIHLERLELGQYPNEGRLLSRSERHYRLGGKFPCKDGYVVLLPVQENQWQGLMRLLGNPDWAGDEMCKDEFTRAENSDVLQAKLGEIIKLRSKEELYHEGQGYGVPISPMYNIAELVSSPQLNLRKFFVPMNHPKLGSLLLPSLPFVFQNGKRDEYSPAPKLGEDNEGVFCGLLGLTEEEFAEVQKQQDVKKCNKDTKDVYTIPEESSKPDTNSSKNDAPGPLKGVRILDFTWAWAGPHGTHLLASMGAEIIKVESRKRPDHSRIRSIATGPSYNGINAAPWFNDINPNKLSLSLDLKNPEAIKIIKDLVRHCDIVTNNFRPGVMEKLGLSYEVLKEIKPDIIMASSSLNGTEGPERGYGGYAPNFSALGGLSYLTGRAGEPPSSIAGRSDLISGVYLAFAAVVALCYRQRIGEGLNMDVSSREVLAASVGEAFMEYAVTGSIPVQEGNIDEKLAPHNCYPCIGQDSWISIAVGYDEEWKALCRSMGEPLWALEERFQTQEGRIRHREELDVHVGEWTKSQNRDNLIILLQEAGVAAFGSLSNKDLWEDPHIRSRNIWLSLKPHLMDERAMVGPPFHFSKTPARLDRPAPLMGEHNHYVLGEILGLSDEKIHELEKNGVLD